MSVLLLNFKLKMPVIIYFTGRYMARLNDNNTAFNNLADAIESNVKLRHLVYCENFGVSGY